MALPGSELAALLGSGDDRGDRVSGADPPGAGSFRGRTLGRRAGALPRGRACGLAAGPGARLDHARLARGASRARAQAWPRLERIRSRLAASPRSGADGDRIAN